MTRQVLGLLDTQHLGRFKYLEAGGEYACSLCAGSALQQRDVQALVESVTDLDWDYLKPWAVTLEVKDLLDQVKGQ